MERSSARAFDTLLIRALASDRPTPSQNRRVLGCLVGGISVVLLTALLVMVREHISVATALLLYLPIVLVTTVVGGLVPGVIVAVASPTLVNWYLVPPFRTLRVSDWENILELSVFVLVAACVALFSSRASRREREAVRERRNTLSLAELFAPVDGDEIGHVLGVLVNNLDAAEAILRDGAGCEVAKALAAEGAYRPENVSEWRHVPVGSSHLLTLSGMRRHEERLLEAYVAQLERSLERRSLRQRALEAEALARTDELRTALLRSVSHDLRTPLAGIKAAVSGLRQDDVVWSDDETKEFLELIESETDRLTAIVTDLLDMSRIEAGVVVRRLESCDPAAVVDDAISDPRFAGRVQVQSSVIGPITTDPALLERIIANLVDNAVKWSLPEDSVTVRYGIRESVLRLEIIDHGPGIPDAQKNIVRRPFHRLDDSSHSEGLGLGLAIVDRLVSVLEGRLELSDSPGGGVTATVDIPTNWERL